MMSTPRHASPLAIWSALAAVYVIWGSTYLAIAIAVQTLPPLFSAGLRFCVAGLVLLAFIAVRRGLRARREQLIGAVVVGLLLLVGGNGFVVLAERTVPSGLTALIVASVPLWIVIFRRLAGDRINRSTFVGVAVGFAGVAFLVVLGAALGELGHLAPATWSASSLLAMAYLVVFGSLVAFTAYSWLLQHAPVSLVSTYAYVNPVVAVLLGALVLAEPITPSIVIGAAIIVAAVAFIVTREGARQRAARATAAPRAATSDAD